MGQALVPARPSSATAPAPIRFFQQKQLDTLMKIKTNAQILVDNQHLRDDCISWLCEVARERQEEMLGVKAHSIVAMYTTACREIERCEGIENARHENRGTAIVFRLPEASADGARA
jgi:hypothetical protein